MRLAKEPCRFGQHENAFGFLRLLFASLVIVAHTPVMVDGNGRRELVLQAIGGGLTFGGLAVSGFFIISGFLITASFLKSPTALAYLQRRIARIYPAFAVMFLVCLLVVVPLAGAGIDGGVGFGIGHQVKQLIQLKQPDVPGAFAGLPLNSLNGAIWTIQYEFKCYLLVMLLGALGLLHRAWITVGGSLLCLFLSGYAPKAWLGALTSLPYSYVWLGWPEENFRMVGLFLAGASFYLLQPRIPLRGDLSLLSGVGLLACLVVHPLANLGLAVFGSYMIFAAAQAGARTRLKNVNNSTDISYGLYLYAWPVEQLLIRTFGDQSLVLLGGVTWLVSAMMGWVSWTLIERPVMRWTHGNRSRAAIPAQLQNSEFEVASRRL